MFIPDAGVPHCCNFLRPRATGLETAWIVAIKHRCFSMLCLQHSPVSTRTRRHLPHQGTRSSHLSSSATAHCCCHRSTRRLLVEEHSRLSLDIVHALACHDLRGEYISDEIGTRSCRTHLNGINVAVPSSNKTEIENQASPTVGTPKLHRARESNALEIDRAA